jgi:flagellin
MNAQGLGLQSTNGLAHSATFLSLSSPDKANAAIGMLDNALKIVNKQRADLGAYQNRLDYARKGLSVGAENLQAAESRIRDTDMASAMVQFVKDQILVQASTAMLAQANQKPQSVLQLFR